jgi:hypothetical protein
MRPARGRSQRGQASPEFLGLLVFAVALVVALGLSVPSIADHAGSTISRAICLVGAPITGESCPARPVHDDQAPKDPCVAPAQPAAPAPAPAKESWAEWGQRNGVTLPQPGSDSPQQVAAKLRALSPAEQDALAHDQPEIVGRLDGAPPQMRYTANRVAMGQTIDYLRQSRAKDQAEICRIDGVLEGHDPNSPPSSVDQLLANRRDHLRDDVAGMDKAIGRYRSWAQPGRQFLLFDPSGDGRVAEVFGGLDTAHDVAVVVPGMGNDQSNFDTQLRPKAQALYGRSQWRAGGGVATVAWLGYDAPEWASAALPSAADDGRPTSGRSWTASTSPTPGTSP